MKLSPFSNSLKILIKELFDLIISKTSSDGGDFPRIIEIALSLLKSTSYFYIYYAPFVDFLDIFLGLHSI